mgnify:CR=1 FL=1
MNGELIVLLLLNELVEVFLLLLRSHGLHVLEKVLDDLLVVVWLLLLDLLLLDLLLLDLRLELFFLLFLFFLDFLLGSKTIEKTKGDIAP